MNLVGAEAADEAGGFAVKTSIDIIRSAMKIGIVGSRDYPEPERVDTLVGLLDLDTIIISGGAEGIDQRATSAGLSTRRPVIELKPIGTDKGLWVKAAFARNKLIALCSDVVVAFWTGESKGTADTIRHAMRISGKCIICLPGEPPAVWVNRL